MTETTKSSSFIVNGEEGNFDDIVKSLDDDDWLKEGEYLVCDFCEDKIPKDIDRDANCIVCDKIMCLGCTQNSFFDCDWQPMCLECEKENYHCTNDRCGHVYTEKELECRRCQKDLCECCKSKLYYLFEEEKEEKTIKEETKMEEQKEENSDDDSDEDEPELKEIYLCDLCVAKIHGREKEMNSDIAMKEIDKKIYISGNTYPIRSWLFTKGFTWNKTRKDWSIDASVADTLTIRKWFEKEKHKDIICVNLLME